LYYAKFLSGLTSLWRVPVDGGEEIPVLDSLNSVGQFAVVDRGIYYVPVPDAVARWSIQYFDFASGKIRQITELQGEPWWGLSVSPDGRFLLYTRRHQASSDLMLVENFR
jgi:hypothetical protein